MMMATFAVATPHALVLTVSHGLLFRQPPYVPTARMPPLKLTECHSNSTHYYRKPHRSIDGAKRQSSALTAARHVNLLKPQQYSPHRRFRRGVANPSWCATFFKNARRPDGTSRSESGDPVCRLIRLWLSRLSFHLACAANPLGGSLRAFEAARHPIISGRFRICKLVGSDRLSKCFFCCFFAGVQCCKFMSLLWNFLRSDGSGQTRKIVVRR